MLKLSLVWVFFLLYLCNTVICSKSKSSSGQPSGTRRTGAPYTPCYTGLEPLKCAHDKECCTGNCQKTGWCFRMDKDWTNAHPGRDPNSYCLVIKKLDGAKQAIGNCVGMNSAQH